MQRKIRNRLLLVFILSFPFLVLLGCFIFLSDELPAWPPMPKQNGYGELVKAGDMVSSNTFDYERMNQPQLARLVSQNAAALSVARTGLFHECAVPVEFSTNYIDAHLDQLSDLKRLAEAFMAEGALAKAESHPDDVVHSDLNAIQLADDASRGGVLLDQLVGTAIEGMGTRQMAGILPQLDAATCRQAAKRLEALDAQRQTWAQVMQQEHNWSRRAFPGLRYELARILTHRIMDQAIQKPEGRFNAQVWKTRQLMIALAARAYELDKGKAPASIGDLAPDYLKAIPQDPATGTNLVFQPAQ